MLYRVGQIVRLIDNHICSIKIADKAHSYAFTRLFMSRTTTHLQHDLHISLPPVRIRPVAGLASSRKEFARAIHTQPNLVVAKDFALTFAIRVIPISLATAALALITSQLIDVSPISKTIFLMRFLDKLIEYFITPEQFLAKKSSAILGKVRRVC